MDFVIEAITNFFEIVLLYCAILIIDPKNRLSLLKVIIAAGLSVFMTEIVDYFDLPFYLFFTTIIHILVFYVLTRNKFIDIFSDVTMGIIIIGLFQLASMILTNKINSAFQNNYVFIIITIILIIIFYLLSKVKRIDIFIDKIYRKNRRIYLLIIINIVIVFSVVSNMLDNAQDEFWDNSTNLLLIIISYILVNILLVILLFSMRSEKKQKNYYIDYSKVLEDMLDKFRHDEHEYRNHMTSILAFNNRSTDMKTRDNIDNYIERILGKSEKTDIADINDNTILSIVMNYHKKNASNYDIDFDYTIDEDVLTYNVQQTEITEILNNLVNNAIEASKDLPEGKRYVKINFNKGYLTVTNSIEKTFSDDMISKFFEKNYSSKGKNRGLGLINVKNITDRNNICLEAVSKNNEFIIKLIFPDKSLK